MIDMLTQILAFLYDVPGLGPLLDWGFSQLS